MAATRKRHLPTLRQAEIHDVVSRWMATPESEREHKTLKDLFTAQGWGIDKHLYDLAQDPATYGKVLSHITADALRYVPQVLRRLAEDAASDQRGNNKAAEVFLGFVRQTLTDDRMMEMIRPTLDVSTTIKAVVAGARELLALGQALPSDEQAALAAFDDMRMIEQPPVSNKASYESAIPALQEPPAASPPITQENDHG